ncbi:MAG TPA: hypothetical protein VGS04_04880 [Nitrososphaerales archaeon]|nr:hypothetical protein [Nitrososphaerales archaeon]
MYPQTESGLEPAATRHILPERRLALIHRVLVPSEDYPKEYAVLVTDRRSVFMRQPKTRNAFVLRGEMRFGTALVTDVVPKTLEDYARTSLESLAADRVNLVVPHESVTSLAMRKDDPQFRRRDFFVRLTMRRQRETFQVYNFQMDWRAGSARHAKIRFYAVPLGAYFKPRRLTQSRETILREYALDLLKTFQQVLPEGSTLNLCEPAHGLTSE